MQRIFPSGANVLTHLCCGINLGKQSCPDRGGSVPCVHRGMCNMSVHTCKIGQTQIYSHIQYYISALFHICQPAGCWFLATAWLTHCQQTKCQVRGVAAWPYMLRPHSASTKFHSNLKKQTKGVLFEGVLIFFLNRNTLENVLISQSNAAKSGLRSFFLLWMQLHWRINLWISFFITQLCVFPFIFIQIL